jgi:hypothetical protein
MVPERYTLAAVGRFLLEAFERKRPATADYDEKALAELAAEASAELARMQQQARELGLDDPPYWQRVAEAVRTVVVPRYVALAGEENALARKEYGLWRGGDLIARGAFAGVGLVLGALAVAIPWIPVTEKWVPWALFVAGPFLPDAYFWWYRRRYRRKLEALLAELSQAGRSLEEYRPLSEMQRALQGSAEAPATAPEPLHNGTRAPARD